MVAGFLAAGAVLTRSAGLAVLVTVPLLFLAAGPRRLSGFAASLVVLLVVAMLLVPWAGRNYWITRKKDRAGDEGKVVQEGHLVLTTLKVGESLYEAVGPNATGGPNKENTIWPAEAMRLWDNEYARNQLLLRRSLEYMRHDAKRTLRLAGRKFLRTWNVVPNWEGARTPAYVAVSIASYVPVMLLALVGLFSAVGRRPRELVWLLAPVIVVTLMHMVFVGSIRYRLPVMPLVMLLSGTGAWRLVSGWKASRMPVVATAEGGSTQGTAA
jgi:hypothetical protein